MSGLEQQWHRLVSGAARDWWAGPARAGLSVLSAPYAAGISAYRSLFDFGLIRPAEMPCAVVSVGNITLGGTGKTTTVRWLIRRLREWGLQPAILSRGYRAGGTSDPERVTIVAGPEGVRESAADGGDEPVLLARSLPGVPVLIGKRRIRSGLTAWEQFRPDVLVMDDAFQYWRLRKDVEILLLDATNPFGGGRVFPRGLLREPLRGLRRAHCVLLTHSAWADNAERDRVLAEVRWRVPGVPVAEASHKPVGLRNLADGEARSVTELGAGRWLAVSGLGRPGAFERTLAELGVSDVVSEAFPDHHAYTQAEIAAAAERVRREGLAGIVTTEKDAVKIDPSWAGGALILVVEIDLEFRSGREELEALVRERLRRRLERNGSRSAVPTADGVQA